MIVRSLSEIHGGDRDVSWGNGRSRRFLLEKDGMGFSMTDTVVKAGTESRIQYQNHLEACYCIEGDGEIETMDGTVHRITPGTMYAPNANDEHWLRGGTRDMRLVCVFSPALKGDEAHSFSEADAMSVRSSY